ncbi:hypothetical protein FS837_009855 [Tulasnella sp. UAMH 9824]|nr:hypothetical protein FS837_009855 [Tulasnella sp. UAMH 9824]
MKFNVTIASPSPLIALGSLIFNGTQIWLESVWETQNVPYTVYLNAEEYASVRSPSNDLLYHATNLRDLTEQHTVVVQPARLLDAIIIEMDLGDEANMMMSMDDGQLFQQDGFVATGEWNTYSCLGAGRAGGTCHVSGGSGSEISYTFEGDAITLWGAAENSSSLYQVSVDGVRPISYSPSTSYSPSNTTTSRPITILAHYSNLGPGSHTLKLTSLPKDGKSRIEVDYAQVYTKSSLVPTSTGPSTASSTSMIGDASASSSHLSKSAIIAIVVGTLLGVLALVGLFFIYKLRQKNKQITAARRREAAVAAAGVRVDFSLRRSRDFDEATLASSRFSVKEGLELSVIESQTEARKPEEAAKR